MWNHVDDHGLEIGEICYKFLGLFYDDDEVRPGKQKHNGKDQHSDKENQGDL